jgi:hypothetical protein
MASLFLREIDLPWALIDYAGNSWQWLDCEWDNGSTFYINAH